jgi:hypothetical protein
MINLIQFGAKIEEGENHRRNQTTKNGGIRRALNAHGRESPLPEDQRVIERDVDEVARHRRIHVGDRIPPPGEKAAHRRTHRHHHAARHQDGEVVQLLDQNLGGMTGDDKDPPPHRNEQNQNRPAQDPQPEPLRGGLAASLEITRPVILGDKGIRVPAQRHKSADQRKRKNPRRKRGLNGNRTMPREKHAIHELHHRERPHADHQRPGDAHHFADAAGLFDRAHHRRPRASQALDQTPGRHRQLRIPRPHPENRIPRPRLGQQRRFERRVILRQRHRAFRRLADPRPNRRTPPPGWPIPPRSTPAKSTDDHRAATPRETCPTAPSSSPRADHTHVAARPPAPAPPLRRRQP